MKKLVLLCAVVFIAYLATSYFHNPPVQEAESVQKTERAQEEESVQFRNGSEISGAGTVIKILADDTEGDQHQRFILQLPSGQSLLVAHNIDLAPRIPSLQVGDRVEFKGEYIWNSKGGVVHWTHSDPSGRHQSGWLKHDDRTFR